MEKNTVILIESAKKRLNKLVSKPVTVWVGRHLQRKNFDTAISVCGILEKHPNNNAYRVVFSEGIYSYFEPSDVELIVNNPTKFKDGSIAVIKIII